MKKAIKIKGIIEPEMLQDLAKQIKELDLATNDTVDVLFDSVGGVIDVAFKIAEIFEKMQDEGVQMCAVAEGKVFSSAIIPFLAIENRVAQKQSSFLIHRAKYPQLEDVDLVKIEEAKSELNEYTELMLDYYADHGISPEVCRHLKEGDDLIISSTNEMIDAGFIHKSIEGPANILNKFRSAFDVVFPPTPKFSYIINSKNVANMTTNQVKVIAAEAMREAIPDLAKEIVRIVNQTAVPEEELPENESNELTEEELAKLKGTLRKTPAEVEGNEMVKYLVHTAKDVEIDHDVIPVAETGEVVSLEAGDHKCTVNGEEFVIHSTGVEWYIHGKDIGNEEEPEEQPAEEPEEEPEDIAIEEAPKEVEKPTNQTKAPKVKNMVVPKSVNKAIEAMYNAFKEYGPGCIGH